MVIHLDKEHRSSKELATEVAKNIVSTQMENVSSNIFIDPVQGTVVATLDQSTMEPRGITIDDLHNIKLPNCTVEITEGRVNFIPKEAKHLKRIFDKVPSIVIKGLKGTRRALVTFEENEWLITTEGSNLSKVLKVPGVDPTRIITNDIHEVADVLGIEAARNVLIKEAIQVLEEQGLDVDGRHIMLVSDIMCQTGEVRQIGRHGVSGEKSSVIARAAFEITVATLVGAAVKGTLDMFRGATESVIIGQNVPIGTGLIDLYMGHKN
jgi:DNA-directed RNA polymerase subunit A"